MNRRQIIRSAMIVLRLATISGLIVAIFTHGNGYLLFGARAVFAVAVLSLLGMGLFRRRTRGPLMVNPPVRFDEPPTGLTPGWYPDYSDSRLRRHWDGSTFTKSERWDGKRWTELAKAD